MRSNPSIRTSDTAASRSSLRRDPAIDDETGAGHKAGIVRGEKDDALGDVGHRSHAADRQPRQRLAARGRIDRAISRYSRSYGIAGIPPWRGAASLVIDCGGAFA